MQEIEITNPEEAKEDKKKKKAEKEEMTVEKLLISYERTLIAWIKAATHILIFGFALYKLLDSKLQESVSHPVLELLTPRRIAVILFCAGFFALLMATIRHIQIQKKYGQYNWRTYFKAIMLLDYVILIMLLLLVGGISLGK
ncbi:MAG: DUF202 domain-containing protein [Flammeovirgaceae bacterium]|nr:DUF202 domain-containing protein [Flammeovirgaceae bacterium]